MLHDTLRFSQRITRNNRIYTSLGILCPPGIYVRVNFFGFRKIIYGQAKSRLGNKMMTFNYFKWSRYAVILYLIITGNHPNFAFVFEAYLRSPGDMTCSMQPYTYPIKINRLYIWNSFNLYIPPQAKLEDWHSIGMA